MNHEVSASPPAIAKINELIGSLGEHSEKLIPLLLKVQREHHYLPPEVLREIGERTSISPSRLAGVSTFYTQFRLRPAGQHRVRVCIGTACHVKGADTVYRAFREHLRIPEADDTDAQRLFTVEKVACLGCCMLAPAVQVDETIYGHVTPGKVGDVLRDVLAGTSAEPAGAEAPRAASAVGEVRLCRCSSCAASGAGEVFRAFQRQVADGALPVTVREAGCRGASCEAPLVDVLDERGERFVYGRLRTEHVAGILRRHFRPSTAARRLRAASAALLERLAGGAYHEPVTRYALDLREGPHAPFWNGQTQIATEGGGERDPLDLDAYRRAGGFAGFARAADAPQPAAILEAVRTSGLRGRGGAGFPTFRKWQDVRAAGERERIVVCNGDEGDPGAFMDRMILESFPFRVIEGLMLAARAVEAPQGYLYIRGEYPLAVRRVEQALEACRRRGLLGTGAAGCGRELELTVVEGAGAFVCGEETALLAAIEGRRGMPRYRPPYPSEHGLWGRPTLVQNVETLALIPWIVRNGGAAFAGMGTDTSRGTKTFALAGKVRRGGLIEVPMGISLRRIVEEIGGGVAGGRELKAIQVGGPSGGCIPAALADVPVDYESLSALGGMMGSGGLVVLDDTDCMVDIARYFLVFTQSESCGKCTPCRVGTKRMLEALDRLCDGTGGSEDVAELERLAVSVGESSLCGLGRTAPNPVLTTLQYFRDEYAAHASGICPAGRCRALVVYAVQDTCIGCTRCAQHCPVKAIEPRPYRRHEIDSGKCIRCGICRDVCPVEAVRVD